jgi:mannose-6-phosphate isomerase-like protein (cupin superfamily)
MSKYSVAKLTDIGEVDDAREPFRPIRHHFGITSFGITAWTGKNAGDRIINEHAEDEEGDPEELYLVHEGHARFEIDGEAVDAPAGTFVFVPPGATRTAFAEQPGTTVVAMGATPGQPYEVFGWEVWAPLNPLYREGRYDEVAERGREIAEANPQYPGLLYNVACCESMAGRREDAIGHLRTAIERSPQLRAYAKGDSDFDPIRDDPAFKELVPG